MKKCPHSIQYYRTMKELKVKKHQSTTIYTNEGKTLVADPNECNKIITKHFQPQFQQRDIYTYSLDKKPLNEPIKVEEVCDAIKKLNNGRTSGFDGITAELLKNAQVSDLLHKNITDILNGVFENGNSIKALTHGILIPIKKPNKPIEELHLRPIILLTVLRKAYSLICLERMQTKIPMAVSSNQSGFMKGRGTSDCVWTHKFLSSTAMRCRRHDGTEFDIHITGIDFSKAFDKINRRKLIDVLKKRGFTEDDIRMVEVLLNDTTLQVKYANFLGTPFDTNIGVPQGDGLSPILFVIYLTAVIEDLEDHLPVTYNIDEHFDIQIIFADDLDFVSTNKENIRMIEEIAPTVFEKWNLTMNISKTERTIIKRIPNCHIVEEWRKIKKLGSLLGDKEDIKSRKQQAGLRASQLWKVFANYQNLPIKLRVEIYNTYVRSALLYNCGTWGVTNTEIKKLESFHRKQLRKHVLKIHYPNHISNEEVYQQTNTQRIGIDILKIRFSTFQRVLALDLNTPPNQAMDFYFNTIENLKPGEKFKGPHTSCLAKTLRTDLKRIGKSFDTKEDLDQLRIIAKDKNEWIKMQNDILDKYIIELNNELCGTRNY